MPVCTIHGRNTENEWEQEIRKLLLIDVFCSVFCVLSSTTLIKIEDGHNWSKWINNFKSQKKRKKEKKRLINILALCLQELSLHNQTHTQFHSQLPGGLCRWGPGHAGLGTYWPHLLRRWRRPRGRSLPSLVHPCLDLTTTGHTADLGYTQVEDRWTRGTQSGEKSGKERINRQMEKSAKTLADVTKMIYWWNSHTLRKREAVFSI